MIYVNGMLDVTIREFENLIRLEKYRNYKIKHPYFKIKN